MAQVSLNQKCRDIFGCPIRELSEVCWKLISSSRYYYNEKKGHITSIVEIDAGDWFNHNIYGVVKLEKTYEIFYTMYNKDGSACSTSLYWSSLKGGTLCYGTDVHISFKANISTVPVILVEFTMGFKGNQTSAYVMFGGTEPTLEEKNDLINLLMEKAGIKYWYISLYPTQVEYTLCGQRDNYITCTKFLKKLLKGKYTPKKKDNKTISKIQYLGKGVNPNPRSEETLGVYKLIFEDQTSEFKKIAISKLNAII